MLLSNVRKNELLGGLFMFNSKLVKYFEYFKRERLNFTFDGLCKVDDLVFVFDDFYTLSVRVISNAERTRNCFCIFSIIKEQQLVNLMFKISEPI